MKNLKIFFSIAVMAILVFSCRPEENAGGITSITFLEQQKRIFVGDVVSIGIQVNPFEAKNMEVIQYSLTQGGIVEIKGGSSNDGVVVEAVGMGTVVLMARSSRLTAYCSITVAGSDNVIYPYIITPVHVLEIPVGERRQFAVQIAGGSPLDNSGFSWSYSGQGMINFEGIQNVGTIDAVDIGDGVITVSHPRAQFSVNILVYVVGNDEMPQYITSGSNVVNMKMGNNVRHQFGIQLVGLQKEEANRIVYDVVEGRDVIDVSESMGTQGIIKPLKEGVALIEIYHPLVRYPFSVQVFVNSDIEYNYIEVDKSFIIMGNKALETIYASYNGMLYDDILTKYDYELSNNDTVSVTQAQNIFFINSIQDGSVILTIKNEYADFDREVLIIVSSGSVLILDNEKFITTSQNVITMELGGSDAVLRMSLSGGNSADANNFTWYVEDSSVVGVEIVSGNLRLNEMYVRSSLNIEHEIYETQAILSAKKVGSTKITLEHPKSKNVSSVIIRVYPKGTFGSVPVVLAGDGLHRVSRNTEKEVRLSLEAGDQQDIGYLEWETTDGSIASASGAGLSGIITAHRVGITNIVVNGNNLKQPYRATVLVTDESGNSDEKLIYVLNPYVNMVNGQNVMMKVESENLSIQEISELTVTNSDTRVLSVLYNNGSLVLSAIGTGSAEVEIKGTGTNEIKVYVTVEEEEININYPYSLRTEETIIGLVKDVSKDISVNLVGGNLKEEAGIIWTTDRPDIVTIVGNGRNARITGFETGQVTIKASHPKSVNRVLEIVVYIVNSESELNNKIVIYADRSNYLLQRNESVIITVKTNASDSQKQLFVWEVDNPEIIDSVVSQDMLTVRVTGLREGITRLTVKHPTDTIMPQSIFISVVRGKTSEKYIGVQSIVEIVKDNNLMISAITENLNDYEIYEINWEIDDNYIAEIIGSGQNCIIQPKENGKAIITVRQKDLNFEKDIVLYVYSNYEEMTSSYIMAADNSYFRISVDDMVNLNLVFGSKGFPEHEIPNIRWATEDENVVEVMGNGRTAVIRGKNEGIAIVTASSIMAKNREVKFQIEVSERVAANNEYRIVINDEDKIKGIVVGRFENIELKLYKGTTQLNSSLDLFEFDIEDESKVAVTRIDNVLRITAREQGQTYINVRHKLVAKDVRILICVVLNEYALENIFPLLVEKNNYLIKTGEVVNIKIDTINDNPNNLSRIKYGYPANSEIITVSEVSKKEINVTAINKGRAIIELRYDDTIVQFLYIYVTENEDTDYNTFILTESVIGIVRGEAYKTKINTNVPSNMHGMIAWSIEDGLIAAIETENGQEAVIRGNANGKTYLNVKIGTVERKILVFVCETEQQLKDYRAANIDNRYHVIGKGQNLNLRLISYNNTIAGTTIFTDYYNNYDAYGNVIEVENQNNYEINIKGKNEGLAVIRVQNALYDLDILVYVEVNEKHIGNVENISFDNYLTAYKTLYIVHPDEKDVRIDAYVVSDNRQFDYESYFSWDNSNPQAVEMEVRGASVIVNPLVRQGEAVLTVKHPMCANDLEITVIVGERFILEQTGERYIYVDNVINDMLVTDGPKTIYYELRNMDYMSYENLMIDIQGQSVTVNTTNPGRIIITPRTTGMTKIILSVGDIRTDIYAIVRNSNIGDAVYLTTSENFVVMGVNEVKSVSVRLINYNEMDSTKYKWTVLDESIARAVPNGDRAQIYALREGETKIRVEHEKTSQGIALEMNLKVNINTGLNVIYLTTQTNVIETVADGVGQYVYVQKIGGEYGKDDCTWYSGDPSILSVTGQGLTAMFTPRKAGVTEITVTNIEIPDRPLKIMVIVRNPSGSNMYIESAESLLLLEPGSSGNIVNVNLAGGDDSDNSFFNWTLYNQTPADIRVAQTNGNVITINATGNRCSINAVNDGVARIRVSHSKADNPFYITVQVTRYSHLQFSRSNIEIVNNTTEFVGLFVPTFENFRGKVKFSSDNEAVVTVVGVSNTALLQAKGPGFALVRAWVEGQENNVTELAVNVVEEPEGQHTRVITNRTSYLLNPLSQPIRIRAQLVGDNVIDEVNDDIEWELVGGEALSVIDIFPREGKGREIQIVPKGNVGETNILIKHWGVDPKYWKTINIMVNDIQDAFTLDKKLILLDRNATGTLAANLRGGSNRDYESIIWSIESTTVLSDGSSYEVARVLGSGRNVQILGREDGSAIVTARYVAASGMTYVEECVVIVESETLFSLDTLSTRVPPGEENKKVINYTLRPSTVIPRWMFLDEEHNTIISYEDNTIEKTLTITGLKEGYATLQGYAHNQTVTLNVVVAYDYNIMSDHQADPYYEPMGKTNNLPLVVNFTVRPHNTKVKLLREIDNVVTRIYQADETGRGFIEFYITNELHKQSVTLVQLESDGETPTGKVAHTLIGASFNLEEEPQPYFVRYYGEWSNTKERNINPKNPNQKPERGTMYQSEFHTDFVGENLIPAGINESHAFDYMMYLGDGEEHYILFDKRYENSYLKLGEVKVSNNGEKYNKLRNDGVEVKKEQLERNGIFYDAVRFSGGEDSILYDRVKFDGKLYVDIQSPYIEAAPNIKYIESMMHIDNFEIDEYIRTDISYKPIWSQYREIELTPLTLFMYTDIEKNAIVSYDPGTEGDFVRLSEVLNIGEHSDQFVWGSEKHTYDISGSSLVNNNIIFVPVKEWGYVYRNGELARVGVFYKSLDGLVSNGTMVKQAFIDSLKILNSEERYSALPVTEQAYERIESEIWENKVYYVYTDDIKLIEDIYEDNNINDKGFKEEVLSDYIKNEMEVLWKTDRFDNLKEGDDYVPDNFFDKYIISKYSYRTRREYKEIDESNVTGSTWNVFDKYNTGKNQWSGNIWISNMGFDGWGAYVQYGSNNNLIFSNLTVMSLQTSTTQYYESSYNGGGYVTRTTTEPRIVSWGTTSKAYLRDGDWYVNAYRSGLFITRMNYDWHPITMYRGPREINYVEVKVPEYGTRPDGSYGQIGEKTELRAQGYKPYPLILSNNKFGNVFGARNSWNEKMAMQYIFSTSGGDIWGYVTEATSISNTEFYVDQRYRWTTGEPVIVPIARMNQGPFVYQNTAAGVYRKEVDYTNRDHAPGTTPMPTIDTGITNDGGEDWFDVEIPYDTFNKQGEKLRIRVFYQKRDSHALYRGTSEEINDLGLEEIQGITDWDRLQEKAKNNEYHSVGLSSGEWEAKP